MPAINDEMFSYIMSVRLHIRSEIDCHFAASIVRRTPNITELFIYFGIGWDLLRTKTYAEVYRDLFYMLFHPEDIIC